MRLSRIIAVGAVLAAAALVWLFWPRKEPSPEELVRRIVVETTRYAEEKNLGAMMDHVSDRFRTKEGLGQQEVKQILAAQLFRGQWVRVFTTDLDVRSVSDSAVQMSGKFIFARSDAQTLKDLAKESVVSSYRIDARFEKESDGRWRAVEASYVRAEPF